MNPSTDYVVREVLVHDVAAWLKFDPVARLGDDPEGVHQLRVNSRRLRAELEIFSPIFKNGSRQPLRGELRWIGRILGSLRDLDVLEQLLVDSQVDEFPLEDALFDDLHERKRRERKRVGNALASKRYSRLLRELTDLAIFPALSQSAQGPAHAILMPGLQDSLTTLFELVNRSGPIPNDNELHMIRIKSKQSRYCAEVSAKFLGKPAESVAADLAKVQGVLGDLHDRTVAIDYLMRHGSRTPSPEPDESSSFDLVLRQLSESSEDLRRTWRAPMTRARRHSTALFIDPESSAALA